MYIRIFILGIYNAHEEGKRIITAEATGLSKNTVKRICSEGAITGGLLNEAFFESRIVMSYPRCVDSVSIRILRLRST